MQEIQHAYFNDKVESMMKAYQEVESIISKYKDDINQCKKDILEAMANNSNNMSSQTKELVEKIEKIEKSLNEMPKLLDNYNTHINTIISTLKKYDKMINTFKLILKIAGAIITFLGFAVQFGWVQFKLLGLG